VEAGSKIGGGREGGGRKRGDHKSGKPSATEIEKMTFPIERRVARQKSFQGERDYAGEKRASISRDKNEEVVAKARLKFQRELKCRHRAKRRESTPGVKRSISR